MSRGSGVSGQKKDERNVTEGRTLSCERPFFSEIDVLPWLQGAELRAGVDKDNRLILNMHDHIGPAIAIDIAKLAGHGNQVAAAAKKRWTGVDDRVG